jgi:hypothetical protein
MRPAFAIIRENSGGSDPGTAGLGAQEPFLTR